MTALLALLLAAGAAPARSSKPVVFRQEDTGFVRAAAAKKAKRSR